MKKQAVSDFRFFWSQIRVDVIGGGETQEVGGVRLGVKNMGDWGSKCVGGGRLGVKICGRWEIGTPVSPPPQGGPKKNNTENVYRIHNQLNTCISSKCNSL